MISDCLDWLPINETEDIIKSVHQYESCTDEETFQSQDSGKSEDEKREHTKRIRKTGRMYTHKSKRTVDESKLSVRKPRRLKAPCAGNCRIQCPTKISHRMRQEIFNEFWSLTNKEDKRIYVARLLDRVNPKYSRHRQHCSSNNSNRDLNTACYLPNENGSLVRVCQTFFMNTLDISQWMIRTLRGRMDFPEFTFK